MIIPYIHSHRQDPMTHTRIWKIVRLDKKPSSPPVLALGCVVVVERIDREAGEKK
jgi:hypothetical protein